MFATSVDSDQTVQADLSLLDAYVIRLTYSAYLVRSD